MYNIKYKRVHLNVHLCVFKIQNWSFVTYFAITHGDGPGCSRPSASTSSGDCKRENVTMDERKQIVSKVLKLGQSDGDRMEFPHGTIKSVATEFHVHPKTIRRVWARAQSNYNDPTVRQ